MKNKTFRAFNKETTKKLNILRDLYNLENTARAVDMITDQFFELNKEDILKLLKEKQNSIFKKVV